MDKINYWLCQNKIHITHLYNVIVNDLEANNILINDKKKLYNDIVLYFYYTTIHIKYI